MVGRPKTPKPHILEIYIIFKKFDSTLLLLCGLIFLLALSHIRLSYTLIVPLLELDIFIFSSL